MKNYLKFNLTGKELLPVWLLFMVLFIVPYTFVTIKMQQFQHNQDTANVLGNLGSMALMYGIMLLLIVVEYAVMFYLMKMTIESFEFKGKQMSFSGTFGQFIKVLLSGFILTLITFGIYAPWFATKMMKFFSSKSTYGSDNFEFRGKGSDLFLIILFSLVLPAIFISVISMSFLFAGSFGGFMNGGSPDIVNFSGTAVFGIIIMIILIFAMSIVYMYYMFKWAVNFNYRTYQITLKTNFWNAAGKIALELFLICITAGIYCPLAMLKLYGYFAALTEVKSETGSKQFGYDLEPGSDFLYLWGQSLLVFITFGIYFPWAYCKMTSRVAGKTFCEEISGS
jgi:hypothetical protein